MPTTSPLHTNTVFMCSGPSLLSILRGEGNFAHTLPKGTSYLRLTRRDEADLKGWRRTWLHCSWWGCPVCCTHIEWCIHQELAHCPLHWLSLCALYYSELCTMHQGRQCLRVDRSLLSHCVSSLGQREYHCVYRWGWAGLNSPLGAPGRHWRQLWGDNNKAYMRVKHKKV